LTLLLADERTPRSQHGVTKGEEAGVPLSGHKEPNYNIRKRAMSKVGDQSDKSRLLYCWKEKGTCVDTSILSTSRREILQYRSNLSCNAAPVDARLMLVVPYIL
jgi:hypothetical protein